MRFTWLKWVAAAAVLFFFCGCIELTGQRITMRYDQATDRLYVLLQYDGVHNSKEHDAEDAEKSLRDFVANSDVMLFDWFGRFQRAVIQKELDHPSLDSLPRAREFGEKCLASMEVSFLGHYRDPSGRVGAAQMVVLNRASELIAAGNAAISEAFVAMADAEGDEWLRRTFPRWRALAARGYQWVALEGHSLVWRCEIDRSELQDLKLSFLHEIAKSMTKDSDDTPDYFGERLLAAAPLSLVHSGEQVSVRVGFAGEPVTLRCEWRDDYQSNVEDIVAEIVPTDLDVTLAHHLLNDVPVADHLAQVIEWGPAEEQVRAVIGAARGADQRQHARAMAWLGEFAGTWNASQGSPVAPERTEDSAEYLTRWSDWYRTVVAGPRPR